MKLRIAALLALLTTCCFADVPTEYDGSIDGTVTDEDGKPVKGATVTSMPLGVPLATLIPQAETDEKGYFSIHHLWLVRYAIGAKKEDEGYADATIQFYSDGAFETATLTDDHPTATIAIRLGPKAGVLMGTVADAVTGAPLMPCVELIRASEPNNFLSASGLVKSHYRLLIPADKDVLMRISLDAYKPWYYPGTVDKSAEQAVRLRPGEEKIVDIVLRPDDAPSNTGCPAANSR